MSKIWVAKPLCAIKSKGQVLGRLMAAMLCYRVRFFNLRAHELTGSLLRVDVIKMLAFWILKKEYSDRKLKNLRNIGVTKNFNGLTAL